MPVTLSPNTQPVYPRTPIHWKKELTNQVAPRKITTQIPLLIGTVGSNGALIHGVEVIHLGTNPDSTLRIYTMKEGETTYFLEFETTLAATSITTDTAATITVPVTLPDILPSPAKGLHLEGNTQVFAAVGVALSSGIVLRVRGGNY